MRCDLGILRVSLWGHYGSVKSNRVAITLSQLTELLRLIVNQLTAKSTEHLTGNSLVVAEPTFETLTEPALAGTLVCQAL